MNLHSVLCCLYFYQSLIKLQLDGSYILSIWLCDNNDTYAWLCVCVMVIIALSFTNTEDIISVAQCMNVITPLLLQWSHHCYTLTHWNVLWPSPIPVFNSLTTIPTPNWTFHINYIGKPIFPAGTFSSASVILMPIPCRSNVDAIR